MCLVLEAHYEKETAFLKEHIYIKEHFYIKNKASEESTTILAH